MTASLPAWPKTSRARLLAGVAVFAVAVPPLLAPAPSAVPAASPPPSAQATTGTGGSPTSPTGPAPSGRSPSSPGPSAAANPMAGRGGQVYGQRCASCHGNAAQGTQFGPPLVGAGPASLDFQLSTGRMPLRGNTYEPSHQSPLLSAADIQALVGYVSGFGGGGPSIPDVHPGDVARGQMLYAQHCAACHSSSGNGATLTNGHIAPSLTRATPQQVGEAVRVGPGLMPAFPRAVLSDSDVDALAGYVQTLQNNHGDIDRGGLPLYRIGPFTEGLAAWVLGLALLVFLIRGMTGKKS